MDELKWSKQELDDIDLSVKLYDLSQDKTFEKVDFSENSLQTIPDFKQHKQFEYVEVLNLSYNEIENLDTQRLPCDVKELDMYANHVNELVDLTGCHRLERLWLGKNRIQTFNPRHLPENVRMLDMYKTQLTDMPNVSHCHKLRVLWLSRNQITDLNPHTLPLGIQELKMKRNKLSEIKDFSHHKKLQTLNLSWNQITDLDPHTLPLGIVDLCMSGNTLNEIKDFSNHKKLQTLYLSYNEITDLDPHTLPLDIVELDMEGNTLSQIKDFSHHKKLQELNLRGNKIMKIYDANRDMSFWEIDTFHQTFFDNEHGYNQLLASRLPTRYLIQPPPEVFTRGLQSVQTYFKDLTLSKRVRHSRKRLVLLGPTEAGKSSMVESLIAGEAVLVNIKDRTQIVNLKEWNISEDDILHIYDHGGHLIYSITTPLFVSKDSVLFLVHDVTKVQAEEINQTTEVLRLAFNQYPENKMYIIFTHTDLIDANQVTQNSDFLMGKLKQYLDDEISNLNKLLIQKKSDERQDIVDDTAHLLEHFKEKRSNLPVFHVSSQNYSGMKEVKESLMKVAQEKRVDVPESWVKFYKHILETKKIYLTLKETTELFQKRVVTSYSDDESYGSSSPSYYWLESESSESLLSEEDTQPNVAQVLEIPQHENAVPLEPSVASPSVQHMTTDLDDSITAMTCHDAMRVTPLTAHHICDPNNKHATSGSATNQESESLVPLQYFADSNLCLHYESNPFLKDCVFPDIDLLADLFKSLFHHNISQVINYDHDEKLQATFQKVECELALQRYQNEGLLGQKLLSYLWKHYGLSLDDETVLLHLMQSFNLCYSVSKEEQLLYFPWFVKSQECPPHIDRAHLMKFDQKHASVHLQCEFFNRIPLNVFEMVSVCLQRKATQEYHYMGDRQAWHDGLEISFGSVLCVLTRSKLNSSIDICLYGEVDDIPKVWEVMESLLQDLQAILKPWKGVIRSFHFVCGHCIILQISPPQYWLPGQVFPKPNVHLPDVVKCPKNPTAKNIPAALIMNCFKADDSKERQSKALKDVADYLQQHWEARDPPPAVVYLDCEQTCDDIFSLKWSLPQTEGVPITRSVLELKDDSSEWKPLDGPFDGQSFTFYGTAVEFRVAAVNEFGTGPYTYCTPSPELSIDPLLPKDRAALMQSEMFSQMNSITGITNRLSDRSVLHVDARERVLDCLETDGPRKAARKLLDEICRFTYKQLYLVKKTLIEFGQGTLATQIPLRTHAEVQSHSEFDDAMSSNTTRVWETGPDNLPTPELQFDTLSSQSATESGAVSDPHLVYLRPGIREETTLDVLNIHHGSTTVSIPQPEPQPTAASTAEKKRRLHRPTPQDSRKTPRTEVQEQSTLLNLLTPDQKKSQPNERFFGGLLGHIPRIHRLGANLGMSHTEIQDCMVEVPESVDGQAYYMLCKWQEKEGRKATVKKLLKALQRTDIPEKSYRNSVLDYFNDSDSD